MAARREIREESGIPENELKFIDTLGSYERYRIGRDGNDDMSELKQITIIIFSTSYVDLKPEDPANPFARWVTIDESLDMLTHQKDKQFLRKNREYILSFGAQN
jgi:isopentenyldiphosphate isomerase